MFKRNTTRASDGTYTSLRVTGRDADDNELKPVTIAIDNFQYWSLGKHRTKHLTAPDGLTQDGLREWAEAQAKILQYVGIGEDFTAPFRPHLLVGDVAEVVRNSTGTSLGIVTEVKQVFNRQDGFRTEFSVDSGGVASKGRSVVVYSRTASVHGYNRRQGIIDLIRYTAEKASSVDNVTASDIGAEKKGTSTNLLNAHNESQVAHPYIQQKFTQDLTDHDSSEDAHPYIRGEIAKKLPIPTKAAVGQYLRVLSVDESGNVTGVEAVSASTNANGGISDPVDAETLGGNPPEYYAAAADHGMKIYTTPGAIGCTYSSTADEIWLALPNWSTIYIDAASLTDPSWNLPNIYGVIEFSRFNNNSRCSLRFIGKSSAPKYALFESTGQPIMTWNSY